MAKIVQLDAHVADLIAAGEVVERPASVIKELMENAIDAGAAKLTVEIKGGGMTYMRVTDDGGGIAPEDSETAFLRHATSKLRDEKGLEAIATLGFRGEALAAIAAVSRVELLTKVTGAQTGTSLSLEAGSVKARELAGCPEGTTLIVRDLFFNTPARLKFMKTDRAESASVSAQVIACALSHPEVSVRYIRDGKEELHTPGDNRVDSCVYSLFGREFAGGLLQAKLQDRGVDVSGFVCTPGNARGNRSYQYFFVNGRVVRSKTLQAALEQAYKNSLFTGRFPACVLYITVSHGSVDVNVHPAKTEVKFLHEHEVFDGVYYAALAALEGAARPAEIQISDSTRTAVRTDVTLTPKAPATTQTMVASSMPPRAQTVAEAPKSPSPRSSYPTPVSKEAQPFAPIRDSGAVPYRAMSPKTDVIPPYPKALDMPTVVEDHVPAQEVQPTVLADMPVALDFRVVGEALGTYVLVEKGSSLWLVDKHAAHERLHFDRLKNEKQVTMSQTLLLPVVCNLGREDTALLLEKAVLLERIGLQVEAFGEAAVAVRSLPADVEESGTESLLGELARVFHRGGSPDEGMILDELRHTVACKAAIKAGTPSEALELETLVQRVLSGDVRYCPHGRPVAMELTKAVLDRNFKRS